MVTLGTISFTRLPVLTFLFWIVFGQGILRWLGLFSQRTRDGVQWIVEQTPSHAGRWRHRGAGHAPRPTLTVSSFVLPEAGSGTTHEVVTQGPHPGEASFQSRRHRGYGPMCEVVILPLPGGLSSVGSPGRKEAPVTPRVLSHNSIHLEDVGQPLC